MKLAPTRLNILKAGIKYAKGFDKVLIMRAIRDYSLVPSKEDHSHPFGYVDKEAAEAYYSLSHTPDNKRWDDNKIIIKYLEVNDETVKEQSTHSYYNYQVRFPKVFKFRIVVGRSSWGRNHRTLVGFSDLKKDILIPCFQRIVLPDGAFEIPNPEGITDCMVNYSWSNWEVRRGKTEGKRYYNRALVCRYLDKVSGSSFPNLNQNDRIVSLSYETHY